MQQTKILVVEDDDDLREAIVASIAELGAEVESARDGVEGLERLAVGKVPSAILLDIRMPRLDGQGFLEVLRAEPRLANIPVITMSGGPTPPPVPPVTSRVYKPFDVDEVARILVSLGDSDTA